MVRVLRASGMPKDVLLWVRPVKSGHIVYLAESFATGTGGDRPGHLKPWAGEYKQGPLRRGSW